MNKLLTKVARLALGLSLAAGVGVAIGSKKVENVRAAEGETVYTFATAKSTSNTAYGSTYNVTISGIEWNVPGNQNFSGYVRIGGKNLSSTERVITGHGAINKVVKKVTISHNGKSNNNFTLNSVSVTVASDSSFNNVIETITVTPSISTSTAGTFDISASTTTKWAANSYYKFTFVCTNSTSTNYGFDLKSIAFIEGSSGTPTYSVSYDANATVNVGGTTPSAHLGLANNTTQNLSETGPTRWGYTFGGWATTSSGTTPVSSVTINGADVTVYAIWTADLTVTGAHASNPYTVAQARAAIDAGDHLEANYVSGKISQIDSYNSTYHSLQYWISDDGSTTNQLEVYSGKGLNGADFSATTDIRLEADVVICGTLSKYNTTYQFNLNNYQVSYTAPTTYSVTYDANSNANVSGMPATEAGLSNGSHNLSAATPTKWGYTFGGWAATDNSTTPITSVTINGADLTVYAIWNADLTVKGAHASNPYTVAEARTAIDANTHLQENYVSGIVSQVDSYNSTYHSVTYWISDDGTTTDQLEAYSGKGISGADFSAKSDVEVGARVVVCGTLKLYNTTYEFNQNNYLVSYIAPASITLSSIEITGSLTTNTYATDESWSPVGLTVTATYSDASTANVTNSAEWSYSPATPALMGAGTNTLTITATFEGETDDIEVSVTVTAATYLSSTLVVGTNPTAGSWTDTVRTASVTYDGFTYTASEGGNNGKYYSSNTSWRLYQGNSGTLTISSTTNLIHSIAVTYAVSNTGVLVYSSTQYASGATINTGDVSSVTFGVGNTTSATNGTVQVQSILVKYLVKPEIDSISISGSLTQDTYEIGVDNDWNTAGLTVTLHYLNNTAPDENVTNDVEWSFSPAKPTSASTTSVTITATYTGSKTLTDSESYNVTVNEATPAVVDGKEYILAYPASNYYFTGIVTSGSNKIGQATTYVAFPKTDCVLTAVDNGDGSFSFETTNSKYLTWTSGNTLNEADSISDSSSWNVSKNPNGSVNIINKDDDTRYLQFNNANNQQRFATYTNSQQNPFLIEVDDYALAGNFVECYMHPEIAHNTLDSDSGACKDSGSGYYTAAHDAYVSLSTNTKYEFGNTSDFANYASRLVAWAAANQVTFDPLAYTFTPVQGSRLLAITGSNNTNTIAIIVIISMVSVTAIGGYFFIKRRKVN